MSSFPQFEDDVFISYARIDNATLAGPKGWVELLHERLKTRLEQLLGEKVKIWRDPKLQGNEEFSDVLVLKVGSVALLICVLSPRYLKSEWCLRELNEFCEGAGLSGGLTIKGKARVFKVIKTHIERGQQPERLQGLLGYEFYEYDETTDRAREFSPEVQPQSDPRYWARLEDLAWDIKRQLETLRGSIPTSTVSPTPPTPTNGHATTDGNAVIYLAETTADLAEARNRIRRELEMFGLRVLPDKELPLKAPDLIRDVRAYLQQAELSIHLVGANYGIVPELEESRSIVRLQHELAADGQAHPQLTRLIWLPPNLTANEPRQQQFIETLLNSSDAQRFELLQTKLEDLKDVIKAKLDATRSVVTTETDTLPTQIYLMYDKQDREAVKQVYNHLRLKEGFKVALSRVEGDGAQIRQERRAQLLQSDAVLIFYGQASEDWFSAMIDELVKVPAYGRTRPFLAQAIYLADPLTDEKEMFDGDDPLILKNFGVFAPATLAPFIRQLRAAQGGKS